MRTIALIIGCTASLTITLTGCRELMQALDPCSAEGACEVTGGPDLEATIELPQPLVGIGSTFAFKVTVRNRGDEPSEQTTVEACVQAYCNAFVGSRSANVRGLDPGERVTIEGTMNAPADRWGDFTLYADVMLDDLVQANNRAQQKLEVEAPDLVPTVSVNASEIRTGAALRVNVSVKNQAQAAAAPSTALEWCFSYPGLLSATCRSEPRRQNVAAISAGASWTDSLDLSIPVTLLRWPNEAEDFAVRVCADVTEAVAQRSRGNDCITSPAFTVLPNLDLACNAQQIAVGQTVSGTLTAGNCNLSVGDRAGVWSFEAAANTRLVAFVFDVIGSCAGIRVLSDRGFVVERTLLCLQSQDLGFTVPSTGRYHIVVTSNTSGVSYRLRLTQQ